MRKILLIAALFGAAITNAHAECVATTKTYTACKPGYYLTNGNCVACPDGGTSDDNNNAGITACYLSAGTASDDNTGEYTYTGDCPYVN